MTRFNSHTVSSGDFFVSPKQQLHLKAALGSCVALAMWDDVSDVGGIYHALLPEQPTADSKFLPLKYAKTGLPIFIEHLVENGAEKHRLKTVVAGDALIGPISRQDVDLDIGGRTLEVVREILTRENIHILQSETGGLKPCTLELDMHTWEQRILLWGVDQAHPDTDPGNADPEAVKKTIDRVKPIPQVIMKIMRMINEGTYYLSDIAEEIRKDQVLSAQTLKLCNSARFAAVKRIESIDHALVYLGQQPFAKIIVSAYLQDIFSESGSGYSMCMGGIYHHAIGTAQVAEELSKITGRSSPSIAYIAGLLHDIGKVVLDQHVAASLPLLYKDIPNRSDFLETERLFLGIDHAAVGGILADRWSFPESLADVIRHHHYPENSVHSSDLTHLVYLADLLMSRFNAGLEMEHLNTQNLDGRLDSLGLTSSRFSELVDLIPQQVLETSS